MLAVVDTETTGLSTAKGARILQVALVRIAPGSQVGSVVDGTAFVSYVCPDGWDENNVPPSYGYAEKVHGIEAVRVKSFPDEATVRAQIEAWCQKNQITHFSAYNVAFDREFMQFHRFVPAGISWAECLMQVAKTKHGAKGSLSAMCARSGVEFSSSMAHSALYDALKAAELATRLI
jgi:DNA polymerase-3 subunit epsilon